MTLLLSRADTDGLVSIAEVIEVIENAHADISRGTAFQPAPTTLALPSGSSAFLPMAALADRQALAAVKFLADIPDNASRDLPRQRSILLLLSQTTGECEAIIDGRILTRQRTAATSAVASRYLARSDSSVLGLIGAGNLAVEHVKALKVVLPIKRVLVWSRTAATIAKFLERAREPLDGVEVEVMGNARDVVLRSDVLCTLTPAREPVVQGDWFQPGLHINAVGAPPRPDHREIDSRGMARAKVFVDSFATAVKKSGGVLLALADGSIKEDDIRSELGDVITGASPGRMRPDDITLFDSVGIAMQDLAIGHLLLTRARSAGLGIDLDLTR
jgi:alanine dehydrogenase